MDPASFLATVREANETELDRLGSGKVLLAATGGTLDTDVVRATIAAQDTAVADVYDGWADDAADSTLAAAFGDAAEQARQHAERLGPDADAGADAVDADDAPTLAHLRALDDPIPRAAAGLVARPLVRDRVLLQVLNHLINEAERSAADDIRDVRDSLESTREAGLDMLAERCETAAEEDAASEAVAAYVDAAYADYADSLSALGMDPKPIC